MAANKIKNIYIVDDDSLWGSCLSKYFRANGFIAESYHSGVEFLENIEEKQRGFVLLDLKMSMLSGIETMIEMNARGIRMPVIMLTGYPTVESCVLAMKLGALDYLEKPVPLDRVLKTVQDNSSILEHLDRFQINRGVVQSYYDLLTHREREVLPLVMQGMTNGQIGERLFISPRTVKAHRSNIMKKMKAGSLVELSMMFGALMGSYWREWATSLATATGDPASS